jgi:hypothetical protein
MSVQQKLNSGEISWVVHDYLFFNEIKEQVGLEKARDIYCKVWEKVGHTRVTEAKQKIGIEKAKDFETFKSIMKALTGPTNVIAEDSGSRLVLEFTWCHFCEVGRTILREPMGNPAGYDSSEWVRVAADALLDMDRGMVLATGLEGVSNMVESHMCLGDKVCRRVFELKKESG